MTGPSADPGSSSAPRTTYLYDTRPSSGSKAEPVPIGGLVATYWAGQAFQGTPVGASIGPDINGRGPTSLDIRWPKSPTGSGAFSARLEGVIVIPEGGVSQITNTVGASQVWIDGVRCERACPAELALAKRTAGDMLQVRIDVRSNAGGVATTGVSWTTPTGTGPIPASALRPALPQATATTVRDQLTPDGPVSDLTTQTSYSPSDPQQVISARSASGKVATRSYEPYSPSAGAFGRATGFTSTARDATLTDYYAPGEGASTSCPGAAANQGGLARQKTGPGGLSITQSYDASGNITGQQPTGAVPTCSTYDATGILVRTQTGAVTSVTDYAVQANPLHRRTTMTDGATRTSSTVTDLLGRTVRTTDVWGTEVATSYDSEDRPVQERTVTKKGEVTASTYSYSAAGELQQVINSKA